jgi:hypothetical protein
MKASSALRLAGWALLVLGIALAVAPGEIAVALGTSGPMPANGASDPVAMVFWRQLTFIRMFSAAAVAVGAICLWARSALTSLQQTSFLKLLVGVFAWMFVTALSQQTAIWGARLGWVLVGVIGVVALACVSALLTTNRLSAGFGSAKPAV